MISSQRLNASNISTLPGDRNIHHIDSIDKAAWIWHPQCEIDTPAFLRFRRTFTSDGSPLTIHVSADMRYHLHCDGHWIGMGPDRSDIDHWTYSSYTIELEAGEHELSAEVWWLGDYAPQALITYRGGFILKADDSYHKLLSTGTAEWEVHRRNGWEMEHRIPINCYHDIGHRQHITADEWYQDNNYVSAHVVRKAVADNHTGVKIADGWRLFQSPLPAMIYRNCQPGSVRAVLSDPAHIQGKSITLPFSADSLEDERVATFNAAYQNNEAISIPKNSSVAILIDLENYYCGYPQINFSAGNKANIEWEWAESLYDNLVEKSEEEAVGNGMKGNRNDIANKKWMGFGHSITASGETTQWQPYWWASGRYVLLRISTKNEALSLNKISINESRYPLEQELTIHSSNPLHQKIQPICLRVMQACSHESYMDCPYYEQMMYVGDTRLELLTHYVLQSDRRLPKRAIELFDFSRSAFGFVAERTTSRMKQQSNSFAAIWVLCLHDFALWTHGEDDFIKERMYGMHANLDAFMPYRENDGLIYNEPGWTFIDWAGAPGWFSGYAPGYNNGRCCAALNAFYILALQAAAELEQVYGSTHLSTYYSDLAAQSIHSYLEKFYDEQRGLIADDLGHEYYSQHSNCLAIIGGFFNEEQKEKAIDAIINDKTLAQCTIYFKYYLFEALYRCGKEAELHNAYTFWGELVDQGLKTCVEAPEPTRSDCHAWGAHPLYHLVCSIGGLRPEKLGSKQFHVNPCLYDLNKLDISLPTQEGPITIALHKENDTWQLDSKTPEEYTVLDMRSL